MDKNINTLMIVFVAGIMLISVILVLNSGETRIITGQEQKNSITMSGNAQLEVEPDQAEIFVKIETFSVKADDAKDENARISDKVIRALKRAGVKDGEIETTSINLNPKYKYDRIKGESILQGYTMSNILKITTKDVDDSGKLVDVAIDNGANGLQNVRFGLSKELEKEVSGEALIKAAELAKDKAESLATSLGIKLGKVISIQESNFNFVTYDYAPRLEAVTAEAKAPTEIIPGKVSVSARVTLAYELK